MFRPIRGSKQVKPTQFSAQFKYFTSIGGDCIQKVIGQSGGTEGVSSAKRRHADLRYTNAAKTTPYIAYKNFISPRKKLTIHVIGLLNPSRGMSCSSMLFAADLESLADRRENLSRNFFLGITKSSSCLHHLLPPQGQIPPPQGSGHRHTKDIQGAALVRNVIVHL